MTALTVVKLRETRNAAALLAHASARTVRSGRTSGAGAVASFRGSRPRLENGVRDYVKPLRPLPLARLRSALVGVTVLGDVTTNGRRLAGRVERALLCCLIS